MRPGDLDAGGLDEVVQAAGGRVPVHPAPRVFSRIGPRSRNPIARSRARPTAGGSGTKTTFGALTAHPQHPVAVLLAEIGDVRAGGLEDPQAKEAKHGHQREVARVRRLPPPR